MEDRQNSEKGFPHHLTIVLTTMGRSRGNAGVRDSNVSGSSSGAPEILARLSRTPELDHRETESGF